ncbi:MAG: tetratricopeptide repeat protein [Candidatus Eisenbacteria bacterium]
MASDQGSKRARIRRPSPGAGRVVPAGRVTSAHPPREVRTAGRDRIILAAIGLFALLVRIVYLIESRDNPFHTHLSLDPKFYHDWAQRILDGQVFGPDAFLQAPLYPYLLAGLYALTGPNPLAPQWLNALLGSLTAVVGAALAGRLHGRAALLTTGILLALYKPSIFYTGTILVPVLAALLFAGTLSLAGRRPLLAGVCAGLTGLAHPVLLPAALLMTAGITLLHPAAPSSPAADPSPSGTTEAIPARSRRAGWMRRLLPVAAGAALAILPATVHNFVYSGRLVPISANSGINVYIGNGPQANGFYTSPFGLRAEQDLLGVAEASYQAGRPLTVVESSSFWIDRSLAEMRADPGRALKLYARKVYYTLFALETPQVGSLDFEKRYSLLLRLPALPNWMMLVAAAGFSLVLLRRSRLVWIWAGGVLVTALFIALFFATGRFRFPLHLPLALIAGAGAACVTRAVAPHARPAMNLDASSTAGLAARLRRAKVPLALAVAAGLVLLLQPNWLHVLKDVTYGQQHYRLGVIAESEGRIEEAAREYARALEIDPTVARAAINLGILTARQGDIDRAQPLLERGVHLDPRSARGLLSLGQIHQLRGDLDAACDLYTAAWEADTTYLRSLESLATATYVKGDLATAAARAAALILRAGDDPLAVRCRFLLNRLEERRRYAWPLWLSPERAEGDLALAAGSLREARTRYEAALQTHPEDRAALLELVRVAALEQRMPEARRLAQRFQAAGGPPGAVAFLED